ncbi:MAG TPA: molybdopterin-dependent oxidoreductase, partial [Tepidisphaeraceae bacterium]|nr:molybdopterin-dependent oxidoreductase [Tepidisphaeraceae bacterium]
AVKGELSRKVSKATCVVLSPWMTCEEAWLLVKTVRAAVPQVQLVLGPVPSGQTDELFPVGMKDEAKAKFIIRAEKCPNRKGVTAVIKAVTGSEPVKFADFLKQASQGQIGLAWIVGGYPQEWVTAEMSSAIGKIERTIVQDIFPSTLSQAASVVLPSCAWVEREGTFINHGGIAQPVDAVLATPVGCQNDGQYLYRLAGMEGLYRAAKVREQMVEKVSELREIYSPPVETRQMH